MKTITTANGFTLLQARLKEKKDLLKAIRDEKAHAYTASGDGWHDNPGWTQLGQQEEMFAHEVMLLEQKLANVQIIDPAKINDQKVQIGCKVSFHLSAKNKVVSKQQTLFIVGAGETDVKNHRISYDSPLGKALYNMSIDEEKLVELPAGTVNIKIEEISYE